MPLTVLSVGHSTHPIETFIRIVSSHGIELVADVRRFPGSRRLPQYSAAALEDALSAAGIAYRWIPGLGGRRRSAADSVNTGWRHAAFRAYADHTATEEFAGGLFELMMLASGLRTAMMCSEVLWWRCHRRLIADVLVATGGEVRHVRTTGPAELHRLAPPATIRRGRLSYGPAEG